MIRLIIIFFSILYFQNTFFQSKIIEKLDFDYQKNLVITLKTNLKVNDNKDYVKKLTNLNFLNNSFDFCFFKKKNRVIKFNCNKNIFYGKVFMNGVLEIKKEYEKVNYKLNGDAYYVTKSNKYENPKPINANIVFYLKDQLSATANIEGYYIKKLSNHTMKKVLIKPTKLYISNILNTFFLNF